MTFTVVRAVRGAETVASEPVEKLLKTGSASVPVSGAPMDLPYADQTLRLDFMTADFASTVPADLP